MRKWSLGAALLLLPAVVVSSLHSQTLAVERTRIWSQANPLIEGAYDPLDEFGAAIEVGHITGDAGAELIVGSPNDQVPGAAGRPGSINILVRNSQGFLLSGQQLHQDSPGTPGVAEHGDRFGASLALGDFDCDQLQDLAVGVPGEDLGNVVEAGAVNIFYGNGNQQLWSQESAGIGGFAEAGDRFGASLETHDFDENGCDDLVIGVPLEDVGASVDAGAAHLLFGLPVDGLVAAGAQLFSAPGSPANVEFASSLQRLGSISLVVGAPGAEDDRGYAVFFSYISSGHQLTYGGAYNPLPIPNFPYRLGDSMARQLSFDPPIESVFVGAPGRMIDPAHRGTVIDTQAAGTLDPGTSFYDYFGRALASGDFHSDTGWDLAVSSLRSTDGNGVVHLRLPSSAPAAPNQILDSVPGRTPNPDFGTVLASGDLDGDGLHELLIWDRDAVLEIPGMRPLVFADGFEIGNTTAWTITVP